MKAEGNRKLKIFIKGVSFQRKCGVSRGGGGKGEGKGEGEGEGVLEDNLVIVDWLLLRVSKT